MQKKQSPFFSIILPVYNVEKYLDRCINSIQTQDFEDYEIILVDDGSKDSSSKLCDEWAKKESRIRVIHKSNEGLGMARNSGLELAEGKYIFFVDSDDYVLPGLLSACKKKIDETLCEAVFFGFSRVNAKGKIVSTLTPNPELSFYDESEAIKNRLLPDFIAKNPHNGRNSNIRVSAWNCCISMELLTQNKLKFVSEREYISEDLYFYIELFARLSRVAFLSEAYYCYCQNLGSLTFSYKKERFERLKNFYINLEKVVIRNNYCDEVALRLKAYFIANVLACLKMEAGNAKAVGVLAAYKQIKTIAEDEFLITALQTYPDKFYSNNWKIAKWCVLGERIFLLYLFLTAQYFFKGV